MAIRNLRIPYYPTFIFKWKYIHFALAILFISNSISKSNAQTIFCPPNINFENVNLNNWLFYIGKCCPIVANNQTVAILNRNTLMSGSGVYPYGGFPVVAPDGGNFSLKLGNDSVNKEAERARYYIRIPSGINDYKLIFKYAVVFQDGGHVPIDQPRFLVNAFDSATNALLPCVNFNFVATSALPGFIRVGSSDVYYKNWSSANLDLSGYGGRTIAVDFASGDCANGAHFGYGYVDVICDQFKISTISCKGNPISTLTGPNGFTDYKWYDSSFTYLLGSSQVLNFPTPTIYNKFKLITKPYPTFGCAATLTTIIRISDLNLNLQKDTLVCRGSPFQLQNTAKVSSFFQPINYNWIPSAGLSCNNCLNPIVSPPNATKYVLTTTDVNGCVQKDSFTVTFKLNITNQPKSTSVCLNNIAKFKVTANSTLAFSYQWKKNGVNIIGANADSLVIPIVNYTDTADYSVLVSSFCDSVLSSSVKLKVFFPIFTTQPISILQCSGTKAIFKSKATNDTNIIYKWYKNGNLITGANIDSLVINNIANSDTGFYQIKATGKCISIFSDTVYLRLYKNTTINTQPQSVSQCINTTAFLTVKATGSGVISYQWKKGNTNLLGQTTDSLILNNLNYSDTGIYSVKVKSICDSTVSINVRLSIVPNTKIILQPQSVLQCLNSKVVLKVKGTGTGLVTYQWLKNNNIIPGSTADSLYFNAVNASDSANYSVIVRSQCDSVISQIAKISLYPTNKANLPKTTYLCSEIGKIGIGKFKSYLWSTGVRTDSILVPNNGSYWIKYEDFNGCFNTDTTQIILNSRPLIKAGKDTIMCNDLELKVKGAAINYDSIFWVQNDFGTFGNYKLLQTTFKAKPTTEGNKWLVLSSKNKCGVLLDSFKVYFTPIPNAYFEPSDTLVCQFSKPVTITPIDSIGVFVGEHVFNKLFTPNEIGFSKIKYIISRNFCSSNSEKTIEVVPQPIAEFYTMPLNPNIDKPVQFFSNSKFTNNYFWTFENTTFSNIQNPIYHFLDEGFYRIQLKAINRICSDTTSKLLHIKGSNNIYIPNAFTPNQNGLNEEFRVFYKNSKGAVLSIYNRWGQLVFTSNNVNKGWDGTFDGNPCQEDVYYYIVDYTNNDDIVKQLKGNITLIR